ncbi:hypothetical protein LRAMOSA10597 [Lichtheimia ramosa]|uniref:C2H2-type domain-containing protein n=1 Tax=Lichtheimia ramosa TaxID=688394 RepID=A0A077WRC7_9FUNG|nr:hypothetical protein LRAMOSA10597 [Lichtheimia ramosa]
MSYINTPPDEPSSNVMNNDYTLKRSLQRVSLMMTPLYQNQLPVATDHAIPNRSLPSQTRYLDWVDDTCTRTEKHLHYLAANGYHHPLMHAQAHGITDQPLVNDNYSSQEYNITTNSGLFSPSSPTPLCSSSNFGIIDTSTTSIYHDYQQPDPLVIPDATTLSDFVSLSSSVGINTSGSDVLSTCQETHDQSGGGNTRNKYFLTPPSATGTPNPLHHLSSSDSLAVAPTTPSGANQHEPLLLFGKSGGRACTTFSTSSKKCNKRNSRSVANNALEPQRPYRCHIAECIQAFKRQKDLKRHQKSVHGPKCHICFACKGSFTRTDSLKRHQDTACKGCIKQDHQNVAPRLSNNNINVNFRQFSRLGSMKFRALVSSWKY